MPPIDYHGQKKVKDNGKIVKSVRKTSTHQKEGTSLKMKTDFSLENMEARKQQNNIFKALKEKNSNHKKNQKCILKNPFKMKIIIIIK